MKTSFIATLALLTLSLTANAGNEGPVGAPRPPDHKESPVLAQVRTAGGFTRIPMEHGVRIHEGGAVIAFSRRGEEPTELHLLATLSRETLARVKASIDEIPAGGELVDLEPGPICYDIPHTNYQVTRTDGTVVAIAAYRGCHEFGLANGEGTSLKKILDGFRALAHP